MRTFPRGRFTVAWAVLQSVSFSWDARAQPSELSAQVAQTLFDEARTLLEEGRYPEACAKFAQSQRLDPGAGTLLNLALCHELEGKTASAFLEFQESISLGLKDGRNDRVELAREHVKGLSSRLVRVRVAVSETMAQREIELRLDDRPLPRGAWGSAVPVDPGLHHIAVSEANVVRWQTSLELVQEGTTTHVPVADVVASNAAPVGETRAPAFFFSLSLGGASLIASAVTGALALDASNQVSDGCLPARDYCRIDDAETTADRARTLAWVSTATLAAGAALTVVAFLLPKSRSHPRSTSLSAHTRGFEARVEF